MALIPDFLKRLFLTTGTGLSPDGHHNQTATTVDTATAVPPINNRSSLRPGLQRRIFALNYRSTHSAVSQTLCGSRAKKQNLVQLSPNIVDFESMSRPPIHMRSNPPEPEDQYDGRKKRFNCSTHNPPLHRTRRSPYSIQSFNLYNKPTRVCTRLLSSDIKPHELRTSRGVPLRFVRGAKRARDGKESQQGPAKKFKVTHKSHRNLHRPFDTPNTVYRQRLRTIPRFALPASSKIPTKGRQHVGLLGTPVYPIPAFDHLEHGAASHSGLYPPLRLWETDDTRFIHDFYSEAKFDPAKRARCDELVQRVDYSGDLHAETARAMAKEELKTERGKMKVRAEVTEEGGVTMRAKSDDGSGVEPYSLDAKAEPSLKTDPVSLGLGTASPFAPLTMDESETCSGALKSLATSPSNDRPDCLSRCCDKDHHVHIHLDKSLFPLDGKCGIEQTPLDASVAKEDSTNDISSAKVEIADEVEACQQDPPDQRIEKKEIARDVDGEKARMTAACPPVSPVYVGINNVASDLASDQPVQIAFPPRSQDVNACVRIPDNKAVPISGYWPFAPPSVNSWAPKVHPLTRLDSMQVSHPLPAVPLPKRSPIRRVHQLQVQSADEAHDIDENEDPEGDFEWLSEASLAGDEMDVDFKSLPPLERRPMIVRKGQMVSHTKERACNVAQRSEPHQESHVVFTALSCRNFLDPPHHLHMSRLELQRKLSNEKAANPGKRSRFKDCPYPIVASNASPERQTQTRPCRRPVHPFRPGNQGLPRSFRSVSAWRAHFQALKNVHNPREDINDALIEKNPNAHKYANTIRKGHLMMSLWIEMQYHQVGLWLPPIFEERERNGNTASQGSTSKGDGGGRWWMNNRWRIGNPLGIYHNISLRLDNDPMGPYVGSYVGGCWLLHNDEFPYISNDWQSHAMSQGLDEVYRARRKRKVKARRADIRNDTGRQNEELALSNSSSSEVMSVDSRHASYPLPIISTSKIGENEVTDRLARLGHFPPSDLEYREEMEIRRIFRCKPRVKKRIASKYSSARTRIPGARIGRSGERLPPTGGISSDIDHLNHIVGQADLLGERNLLPEFNSTYPDEDEDCFQYDESHPYALKPGLKAFSNSGARTEGTSAGRSTVSRDEEAAKKVIAISGLDTMLGRGNARSPLQSQVLACPTFSVPTSNARIIIDSQRPLFPPDIGRGETSPSGASESLPSSPGLPSPLEWQALRREFIRDPRAPSPPSPTYPAPSPLRRGFNADGLSPSPRASGSVLRNEGERGAMATTEHVDECGSSGSGNGERHTMHNKSMHCGSPVCESTRQQSPGYSCTNGINEREGTGKLGVPTFFTTTATPSEVSAIREIPPLSLDFFDCASHINAQGFNIPRSPPAQREEDPIWAPEHRIEPRGYASGQAVAVLPVEPGTELSSGSSLECTVNPSATSPPDFREVSLESSPLPFWRMPPPTPTAPASSFGVKGPFPWQEGYAPSTAGALTGERIPKGKRTEFAKRIKDIASSRKAMFGSRTQVGAKAYDSGRVSEGDPLGVSERGEDLEDGSPLESENAVLE